MSSIIIFGLLLIAIIFAARKMQTVVIHLKWPFIISICLLFILCLVIYSETAVKAALRGMDLWLNVVFPSLFPFFVASDILNSTGFVRLSGIIFEPAMRPVFNVPGSGSFAFAMGISSGYPVGAKITVELLNKGMLTVTEAERLLAFTNNSGPLFIIGAVAVGMYNIPSIGVFLWVCHILACICVGVLFRFYKRKEYGKDRKSSRIRPNFAAGEYKAHGNIGIMLGEAVRNSIMLILAIGGFIILFSVIINLLIETGTIGKLSEIMSIAAAPFGISRETIAACLCGFFEITTGTNLTSSLVNVPFPLKLAFTSMIIGWAGLSVHAQVLSIISSTKIKIYPYLIGKFMQGVFAFIFTLAGCSLLNGKLMFETQAFLEEGSSTAGVNPATYVLSFVICIFALITFSAIVMLAVRLSNKIKSHLGQR